MDKGEFKMPEIVSCDYQEVRLIHKNITFVFHKSFCHGDSYFDEMRIHFEYDDNYMWALQNDTTAILEIFEWWNENAIEYEEIKNYFKFLGWTYWDSRDMKNAMAGPRKDSIEYRKDYMFFKNILSNLDRFSLYKSWHGIPNFLFI